MTSETAVTVFYVNQTK